MCKIILSLATLASLSTPAFAYNSKQEEKIYDCEATAYSDVKKALGHSDPKQAIERFQATCALEYLDYVSLVGVERGNNVIIDFMKFMITRPDVF